MKTFIKVDPKKGRGVFADEPIARHRIIEVCQLIILDLDEVGPLMERYVYQFNRKKAALALGNGSLYNHSDDPNAQYSFDYDKKLLFIESILPIARGEEITIDYGYNEEEREKFHIS